MAEGGSWHTYSDWRMESTNTTIMEVKWYKWSDHTDIYESVYKESAAAKRKRLAREKAMKEFSEWDQQQAD